MNVDSVVVLFEGPVKAPPVITIALLLNRSRIEWRQWHRYFLGIPHLAQFRFPENLEKRMS